MKGSNEFLRASMTSSRTANHFRAHPPNMQETWIGSSRKRGEHEGGRQSIDLMLRARHRIMGPVPALGRLVALVAVPPLDEEKRGEAKRSLR